MPSPTPSPMELPPELFLPEVAPREVKYTVISVDDHVCEPPHTFEGRLPRVVAGPGTAGSSRPTRVIRCGSSKASDTSRLAITRSPGDDRMPVTREPFRFDQMRPSCYDADARVRDMDINGVWAAVNFPSQITGFSGRVFYQAEDQEFGLACTRAWNDWLYEEWYQRAS